MHIHILPLAAKLSGVNITKPQCMKPDQIRILQDDSVHMMRKM